MLNLNHLRIFYFVAKNLSYTKAAKELFITQPAVTAQMKVLEEMCELKLIKKKGRGIMLTESGKALYDHAGKLFEYEKNIEHVIDDMRKVKHGIVHIGATKTYVRYLMPLLAKTFKKKYPMIRMCLDEGSSKDGIERVLRSVNEIAIVTRVKDHPDLQFNPFAIEEMIPIFSPKHPFAKKKFVTVEELAKEPIILRESGSGSRKFVMELFEEAGYQPNILMETVNSDFIKRMVERGDGYSILVREAVQKKLAQKKLVTVPIKDKKVCLDAHIVFLKNQQLSPAANAFLETIEELCPEKDRPINGIRSLIASYDSPLNTVTHYSPIDGFFDYGVG